MQNILYTKQYNKSSAFSAISYKVFYMANEGFWFVKDKHLWSEIQEDEKCETLDQCLYIFLKESLFNKHYLKKTHTVKCQLTKN